MIANNLIIGIFRTNQYVALHFKVGQTTENYIWVNALRFISMYI